MGEGGAEDLVAIRVEYLEYEDGRSGVLGYIDSPGADFPWGDARLWTVQAVARDAGVTETRVRQLLGEGRFPHAFKFARSWLIPEADVRAYFAHPDRRRKGEVRQGALPGVSE